MNNLTLLSYKDYHNYHVCTKCEVPIIVDELVVEKNGTKIPLTPGRIRHHSTGAELILAEEDFVKDVQRQRDRVNELELSSFHPSLVMEDEE
jgi:hypothetical protein